MVHQELMLMHMRYFPHTSISRKIFHGITLATPLLDIPALYITFTKLQYCCACSPSSTKKHKHKIPKHKLQSQKFMVSVKVR